MSLLGTRALARHVAWLGVLAVGLLALLGAGPAPGLRAGAAAALVADERQALDAYGKLPLAFVPNRGQTDARVRYSVQVGGASFYFTQKEAVFSFTKGKKGTVLSLGFLGANRAPRIEGQRLGTSRVNYLIGSDLAKWRTNLPTYGQIVYRDLWPGIDLAFRGAAGWLKYEFRVAPGASVRDIRLAYGGVSGLGLERSGNLALRTPLGRLKDSRPMSHQQIGARRVRVESHFALGPGSAYGFTVGEYNPRLSLVIDPGLAYSTYVGGGGRDEGRGIAVDAAGNAYVTGGTTSSDFPTTLGAFDTSHNGDDDAFVAKLNATGTTLVYSTYLGGANLDRGFGIALDAAGNAYVTGETNSGDFPTTLGAFDTTLNVFEDAFVAKLNTTGTALLYSTYLGGSITDRGFGIALDAAGNAYVTGETNSGDFPTTLGAFDSTNTGGDYDAFVTKLNATGTALLYATYLGGRSNSESGYGIVLDAMDSAYVVGRTHSSDFPTTLAAFDTSYNGDDDAFVAELNASGTALVYSTYLGGGSLDRGFGIALDAAGNAYVTGATNSGDFPTTLGAFDTTLNVFEDAFVAKLNTTETALVYSTYLGGSDLDRGFGIAPDAAGNAYVTGTTASIDFPTTLGAFDTSHNGYYDIYVTKVNSTGTALLYSTYLGGSGRDEAGASAAGVENHGHPIALDGAGSAYVTGFTQSGDFPTTLGAFDTGFNGVEDAFVTKLSTAAVPATLVLTPPAATNPVGTSHTVTATVEDATMQPVAGVVVRFTVTGSVSTSGQCTTGVNGQCTFTYQGPLLPGSDAITAYADTDNDSAQDVGEPTGAATKAWVLPVSTPLCEVTISDGGQIVAANGDTATFGGHAKVPEAGDPSGQQTYQDHGPAQPMMVKSIDVLAVVCSADRTRAELYGQATIDGSGSFDYRIELHDNAEPGAGVDKYWILLSNGYSSGLQTLEAGNVQITVHE